VAAAAAQAGVDAFMVVDLPPDDDGPLLPALAAEGLDFIPFLAPTTPDERVPRIARSTRSFLYYVSLTGVTGAQADLARAGARAAELRARTGLPVAVGFGVKTPDDVRALAGHADGIAVGSAICRAIEQAADAKRAVEDVRQLVRSLRAACGR
jgi:tryptophan synthase alpha chain